MYLHTRGFQGPVRALTLRRALPRATWTCAGTPGPPAQPQPGAPYPGSASSFSARPKWPKTEGSARTPSRPNTAARSAMAPRASASHPGEESPQARAPEWNPGGGVPARRARPRPLPGADSAPALSWPDSPGLALRPLIRPAPCPGRGHAPCPGPAESRPTGLSWCRGILCFPAYLHRLRPRDRGWDPAYGLTALGQVPPRSHGD